MVLTAAVLRLLRAPALVAIKPGHDGSSNLRPSALQQQIALLQQVAATTAAAVGRAQTPSLNTTCYIRSTVSG